MGKWVILAIVLIVIIYLISAYNSLVSLRENIKNAMGQISAQLESRWDALTNLIKATKEYSEYEAKTLTDIVDKRSKVGPGANVKEIDRDQGLFEDALSRINVVVENYPDLKASSVYKTTMDSLNTYENQVRHSRMVYNDTVTKYNRAIKVFPNVLFAGAMGFSEEEYFENSREKEDMPSW